MTNNDEMALKLKAAARKAVPGTWGIARDGITVVSNQSHPVAKVSNAEHRMLSDLSTGMDAEFIATANPANILALLAERDADKKRIAELETVSTAAEKLVRCKGRYHSEQNYRALAALFGVKTPDLPPLETEVRELELIVPPRRCFDYAALAVQERDEQWHKALHDACKRAGIKLEVGE